MRVLVIGSGGREHALVWKLAQSPHVTEIYAAPGNGGMEMEGITNVNVRVDDIDGLVNVARSRMIDLVVPGPELCLTLGVIDALRQAGIACFGPDMYCSRLEGSKAFAKEVMAKSGVPTAAYKTFTSLEEARAHVMEREAPMVVKADGLAAGKGVLVCRTKDEALAALDEVMGRKAFGEAGNTVVVEDFLKGEEVSLLCLCDGTNAVPLPSAQDHKAAYDNDEGPNTGGMGAYSPAPILPDYRLEEMADLVIRPVLDYFRAVEHPFVGVLYAGLMITEDGPKVLEYNVRFGDPECQPLLARLDGDLLVILKSAVDGKLDKSLVHFSEKSAVTVVISANSYPGTPERGMEINGVNKAELLPNVLVFHSGTALVDGKLVADGGRILSVTALGDDLAQARKMAYEGVDRIVIPDTRFRRDIGEKGIRRLEELRRSR